MSLRLDTLNTAARQLRSTSRWMLPGAGLAAWSVHQLLALRWADAMAILVGLLLLVAALRVGQRSRSAALIATGLQLMLAALLLQPWPEVAALPMTAGIVHVWMALHALLALRPIQALNAAEVDAARPVAMQDINMPAPESAVKAPTLESPPPARLPSPAAVTDAPAPKPSSGTRLPTDKQFDADGLIRCPRCDSRQADGAACSACGTDLDRYWQAARRVRELESRLSRLTGD